MTMHLNTILDEWERDAPMDQNDLNVEHSLQKIARLHAKYLRWRAEHSLKKIDKEQELNGLRRNKMIWYAGLMPHETLKSLGWPQYQGPKMPEKTREKLIDSEADVSALTKIVAYHEEAVKVLDAIIWQLRDRTTQCRATVDYLRLTSGV